MYRMVFDSCLDSSWQKRRGISVVRSVGMLARFAQERAATEEIRVWICCREFAAALSYQGDA